MLKLFKSVTVMAALFALAPFGAEAKEGKIERQVHGPIHIVANPTSVPDGGSTLLLFGAAAAGMIIRHRRQAAAR